MLNAQSPPLIWFIIYIIVKSTMNWILTKHCRMSLLEKTNRSCRKCEGSDAKANARYWNQWERMWWRQWRWRWRTKAVAVEYLYIVLRVDIGWYVIRTMAKMAMKDKKTVRIAEKPPPPLLPPPWEGCGVTGLGWFESIMAAGYWQLACISQVCRGECQRNLVLL